MIITLILFDRTSALSMGPFELKYYASVRRYLKDLELIDGTWFENRNEKDSFKDLNLSFCYNYYFFKFDWLSSIPLVFHFFLLTDYLSFEENPCSQEMSVWPCTGAYFSSSRQTISLKFALHI